MKPVPPLVRTPSGSTETDEQLMERFVQGEKQAFSELFTRHAGRLQGALRRMVGAAADDVLQTTFLSIVRARGRYERGAPFRPWLYTVAVNAARDHLRRHRREEPHPAGELPETPTDPAPLPDPGLSRTVEKALAKLPDSQREAIVLHRFEGFSFKEIAELLGVTETAVKVRAHRGYERLRVLLASEKESA
ncbi:MAG TPA: RNA polymerase sigma factor [Myxococcaceae bacterium]|nr:RNA polymerase sigma factor [Myxococcaceae bacterium]